MSIATRIALPTAMRASLQAELKKEDGIRAALDHAALLTVAEEELQKVELAHYQPWQAELLKLVSKRFLAVQSQVRSQYRELKAQIDRLVPVREEYLASLIIARTTSTVVAGVLLGIAVVALLELMFHDPIPISLPRIDSWTRRSSELFIAAAASLAAVAVWPLAARAPGVIRRAKQLNVERRDVFSLESAFLEARRAAVAAALRLTVNDVLGESDALIFPTDAPALVELDSAHVVRSQTLTTIRDFVNQHSASALGLAGPRGVGKSTILRDLTSVADDGALGVYVHSPIKYEPLEFARRLFEEILLGARERHGPPEPTPTESRFTRTRYRAHRRVRLFICCVLAFVGAACLAVATRPDLEVNSLHSLGVSMVVVSVVLAAMEYARSVDDIVARRGSADLSEDPVHRIINDALASLRWRPELTMSRKTGMKPFSALFEFVEDDTTKEAAIDRTHAELIGELRRFLLDYARAARLSRIIIAIDELDKLADTEQLLAAVNGLKALFNINGTHFVVSVSTDALDRFALRGIPARDAFDSSFDAVFSVERLTALHSLSILRSRAAGFPPPLALFCHAWSGGLPRDLLRTARLCIDTFKATQNANMKHLVDAVAVSSSQQAFAAYIRSRDVAPPGRSDELRTATRAMRHIQEMNFVAAATEIATLDPQLDRADLEVLKRFLLVADEIRRQYARVVPFKTWAALESDKESLSICDELAHRMASIGDIEVALLAGVDWQTI